MSDDLAALFMAILIILGLVIVVLPAAVLYAYQVGWVSFEWGVLGLLAALFYLTVLGDGGDGQW